MPCLPCCHSSVKTCANPSSSHIPPTLEPHLNQPSPAKHVRLTWSHSCRCRSSSPAHSKNLIILLFQSQNQGSLTRPKRRPVKIAMLVTSCHHGVVHVHIIFKTLNRFFDLLACLEKWSAWLHSCISQIAYLGVQSKSNGKVPH